MHALLKRNIKTGVHARAGGANVSIRDVTITRDGKRRLERANDVMHRKCAEDFGRFKKVSELRWDLTRGKTVGFCLLQETFEAGATHVASGWVRWKSQNRKIVPPYVEEPLNSKVIKSFLPEQRSRYVFFGFRDSYVLSLWTFDVRFTHSHVMSRVHTCGLSAYLRTAVVKLWVEIF